MSSLCTQAAQKGLGTPGRSVEDIREISQKSTVPDGLANPDAKDARKEVAEWLKTQGKVCPEGCLRGRFAFGNHHRFIPGCASINGGKYGFRIHGHTGQGCGEVA
jgi:hypothetical protein